VIPRRSSLKWPLIIKPLVFHLLALLVAFFSLLMLLVRADAGGYYTLQDFAPIAANAVQRDASGALQLRPTPALREFLQDAPDAWFVAEDAQGAHVSFGRVPPTYASLIGSLSYIPHGDLRGRDRSDPHAVVIRRHDSPAGPLTVIAHGETDSLSWQMALAAQVISLPIFLLLAAVTLVTTPIIVRRALAGVERIAHEARGISASRRGVRLTETAVPLEIAPLVSAVNEALDRLDEGHERQARFIAAAAHELRTPIAILRLKIDATEDASLHPLALDVARLATLAEQLLDLHRLDDTLPRSQVELATLARRTAAELAPLLIARGCSVAVEVGDPACIQGDPAALERVLANLVLNATDHGGCHVVIRAHGRVIDVEDDGPGIPVEAREQVFEAFQRLRPRQSGAGLGLSLARQIIERHGGSIRILDAPGGGALIRIELPQ